MLKQRSYITNQRRRKRSQHGVVFFLCIAFVAFIVIGLTVSVAIRACANRLENEFMQERPHYNEPICESSSTGSKDETTDLSTDLTMSDSIAGICMVKNLAGKPEQIVRKASFITSYNKETKCPNWVAWLLTANHTDGPYKRLNNFHEEDVVPTPRATLEDYRGSGWSRGHMCPAGDNKWNETAMYDSFSLVNVCPQNSSLNSGLWNSLEMDCRRWARNFDEIYIVCGPVFMNREHETIGDNEVVVPEAFFKVVLCLTGEPKAFGVIVRNTEGNKKRDLYYNTVDQVERITGLDFFPALPDDLEDRVEANVDINLWK